MSAWLADKSALVRLAESPDAEEWASRIDRGVVQISGITRLEVGYSARSGGDLRAGFSSPPLNRMPVAYLTPAVEDRAADIQRALAARGEHRGPSIPDLLVAATADLFDLTVLHVDKDFALIAEVGGCREERLSLPAVKGE